MSPTIEEKMFLRKSYSLLSSILLTFIGVLVFSGSASATAGSPQLTSAQSTLTSPAQVSADQGKKKKKAKKSGKKSKRSKAKPKKQTKKQKRLAREKKIVKTAKRYVGVRYRFGGTSPKRGFDCSGFTQFVFKKALKKDIPRTSSAQRHTGKRVKSPRPGDIVWSPGHVAIYVKKGKIIDAPKPGKRVKVRKMWQRSPVFVRP